MSVIYPSTAVNSSGGFRSSSTTPAVRAAPVGLEYLKSTLKAIEDSIADDSSDALRSIDLFTTWLVWIQSENTPETPDKSAHLEAMLEEIVPSYARAVLRRSQYTEAQAVAARDVLLKITNMAVAHLARKSQISLINSILDPKHPFYAKHGYPKYPPPEPAWHQRAVTRAGSIDALVSGDSASVVLGIELDDKASSKRRKVDDLPPSGVSSGASTTTSNQSTRPPSPPGDDTWKDALGVSSCVDIYDPTLQIWQVGFVEYFGATPKDIFVSLQDGSSRWYNIDDKAHVAEFGSRSMQGAAEEAAKCSSDDGVTMDTTQAVAMALEDQAAEGSSAMDVVSAAVVEVVEAEPIEAVARVVEPVFVEDEAAREVEGGMSDISRVWLASLQPGSLVDAKDGNGVWRQGCVLEMKDVVASAAPSGSMEVEPSSHDGADGVAYRADDERVVFETYARVAFLGLSEQSDEWICIGDVDRVRELNTVSGGKRGEAVVRDEIVFIANSVASKHPMDIAGVDPNFRTYRFLESLYFRDCVQAFVAHGGLMKLTYSFDAPDKDTEVEPSLEYALIVASVLGHIQRAASSVLFESQLRRLFALCVARLSKITLQEVRETNTDAFERAIVALEDVAIAFYGIENERTSKIMEVLLLRTIATYLSCPFLNRRLWGLRLLSDVVKRIENTRESPSGIRITRKAPATPPVSSTSGSVSSGANSTAAGSGMEGSGFIGPLPPGVASTAATAATISASLSAKCPELIPTSYRVVRLAYEITAEKLCDEVREHGYIISIFSGENAHASLMQRCGDVLKLMASSGRLDEAAIDLIWKVGVIDREPSALQVLSEVIKAMNNRSVARLLHNAEMSDPSLISVGVVELIAAVSLHFQLGSIASIDKKIVDADDESDRMYFRASALLWKWVADGSEVSDVTAAKCLSSLENVVGTGVSSAQLLERAAEFPWWRHWRRSSLFIERGLDALRNNVSIVPAIRLLQNCISSWPKYSDLCKRGFENLSFTGIPFGTPSRHHVAEYLSTMVPMFKLCSDAIFFLKSKLSTLVSELSPGGEELRQNDNGKWNLSTDVQSALNTSVIGLSRYGYRDTIEKVFDFIHFYARCFSSTTKFIPYSIIESIWNQVLLNAVTADERDSVISFVSRLLLLKSAPKPTSDVADGSASPAAYPMDVVSVKDCRGYLSKLDAESVFHNLLCSNAFIESHLFSESAVACVNRYFRWLNILESGLLVTETQALEPSFSIQIRPTELIGWDVFFKIALNCRSEAVAQIAAASVCSCASRFSADLVSRGEVGRYYGFLVSISMEMLRRVHDHFSSTSDLVLLLSNGSHESGQHGVDAEYNVGAFIKRVHNGKDQTFDGARVMMRILFILNGLLNESAAEAMRAGLRAHNMKSGGDIIRFKIDFKGKNKLIECSELCLERMGQVTQLLASLDSCIVYPGATIDDVRVYCRGKELTASAHKSKSFKELQFGSIETLLVVEKANKTLKEGHEILKTPAELLPAGILSSNKKYFDLFFALIDAVPTPLVDSLWSLLMRLPTSREHLHAVSICGAAADTAEPETHQYLKTSLGMHGEGVYVPRLVYAVQIIDSFISAPHLFPHEIPNGDILSWFQKFVSFGGIDILVQALALVSGKLSSNCGHDAVETAKESIFLLIQAVHGLVKVLATICELGFAFTAENGLLQYVEASNTRMAYLTGRPIKTNLDEKQNAISKATNKAVGVNVDDMFTEEPTSLAPSSNASIHVLLESKGWSQGASRVLDHVSISTLAATQTASLACIEAMHLFSLYQAINLPASVPNSILWDVEFAANIVETALMVWVLCIQQSPDVINHLFEDPSRTEMPLFRFLSSIFSMGSVRFNTEAVPDSLVRGANMFGTWFVGAIMDVLRVIKHLNSAHFLRALDHLVVICFQLRPKLTDSNIATSIDFHQLTLLISLLRDFKGSDISNQVAFQCHEAGIEITNELVVCYSRVHFVKALNVSDKLIAGNLGLLCEAVRCDDTLMPALAEEGLEDLLLGGCLGLTSVDELMHPVVCDGDESRRATYDLLNVMCSWSPEVSLRVSERLRVLHRGAEKAIDSEDSSRRSKDIVPSIVRPGSERRSPLGYVGIRNMGCTCYMNSLLQILYMIPEVRRDVLNSKIDVESLSSLERADHLLLQLQRMFSYLQNSQRRAYNPESWTRAYKDETGAQPVNVMQQQDAQEFLQMLCERLEPYYPEARSDSADTAGLTKRNILMDAFGGKLTNQMMVLGDGRQEGRLRERDESFVCLSLDVAGVGGLENSLKRFVSGETIPDFEWEDGGARVSIMKRQCISELSDTIIFHLKRFELNFDTFLREKVNDEFSFPTFVNLFPYSREGLMAQSSGTTSAGTRPSSYYEYELLGVVVHSGTTDSGHYFSYIREAEDPNSGGGEEKSSTEAKRQWIEFNDGDIRSFTDSRIPAECFGGSSVVYDFVPAVKEVVSSMAANQKSAYMLVYRRVHVESPRTHAQESAQAVAPYVADLRREIDADNTNFLLTSRIIAQPHVQFTVALFDSIARHGLLAQSTWLIPEGKSAFVVNDFIQFAVKLAARSEFYSLYLDLVNKIIVSFGERPAVEKESADKPKAEGAPVGMSSMAKQIGNWFGTRTEANGPNKENVIADASAEEIDETDLALALSLSLQSSRVNIENPIVAATKEISAPSAVMPVQNFSKTQLLAICTQALVSLVSEYRFVLGLLFQQEESSRLATAKLLHSLFMVLQPHLSERVLTAIPVEMWREGILSSTQISAPIEPSGARQDNRVFYSYSHLPSPAARGMEDPQIAAFMNDSADPALTCLKFLLEMSRDVNLQPIAENWRRSDAITWMLREVCESGVFARLILIRREMIAEICDLFLGSQSVTGGGYFVQGTRKRAPSSYISVAPTKPVCTTDKKSSGSKSSSSSSSTSSNIPDWSNILVALSSLVSTCLTECMLQSHKTVPPTLNCNIHQCGMMDELSFNSIRSKTFYSTALKQARYIQAVERIIVHQCYENIGFSNTIAEVLYETFSVAPADNMEHLFRCLATFLAIPDALTTSRYNMLFTGSGSLLVMVQQGTQAKTQYSVVFIKSFVELLKRIPSLRTFMSGSIVSWAPWMLLFGYKHETKCRLEAESVNMLTATAPTRAEDLNTAVEGAKSASGGSNEPSAVKGTYIVVYGESEEERELSNLARAEKCFQGLKDALTGMGANIDALIPIEAFEEPVLNDAEINAALDAAALRSIGPVASSSPSLSPAAAAHSIAVGSDEPMGAYIGDHMTDEEFAMYLQNMG